MEDIKGDDIMLTVFLRHDQSQALDEFQTKLDDRDWWGNFPPEGVEIVSWYVVMGIGQIATLRLPPSKLQAVNVALEKYAWGVFRTEAYPTYDFKTVRERLARESRARRGGTGAAGGTGPAKGAAADVDSGAGGGNHPRLPPNGLFLEQWQSRTGDLTPYENTLGDALEDLFAKGVYDLPDIVEGLNARGLHTPDGDAWTEANFPETMKRLGG
ncbi:MAG: recombinase-like helix-turn-helix domain-containing protein [Rhodospirillaceae bacterium]